MWKEALGADSIQKYHLTRIGNPIVGIRVSYDHLISTVGFPTRWHVHIESGPSPKLTHIILILILLIQILLHEVGSMSDQHNTLYIPCGTEGPLSPQQWQLTFPTHIPSLMPTPPRTPVPMQTPRTPVPMQTPRTPVPMQTPRTPVLMPALRQ